MTINNIKTPDPLDAEVTLTLTGKELLTMIAGIAETNHDERMAFLKDCFHTVDCSKFTWKESQTLFEALLGVATELNFPSIMA